MKYIAPIVLFAALSANAQDTGQIQGFDHRPAPEMYAKSAKKRLGASQFFLEREAIIKKNKRIVRALSRFNQLCSNIAKESAAKFSSRITFDEMMKHPDFENLRLCAVVSDHLVKGLSGIDLKPRS